MALEGITHPSVARQCPLLGEQRASTDGNPMSAFDPKRTFAWWQMANAHLLSHGAAAETAGIYRSKNGWTAIRALGGALS
jgi:hypothetical protein